VTTLKRRFDDPNSKSISLGFDQEAGCVLQARMYTFPSKFEEDLDLIRRIDRSLIRFVKIYGDYEKGDSSSVVLPESMGYFPKFMYFLRRSVIVQSETNSPDETSYYRNLLNREGVVDSMTMIVPVLRAFHYQTGETVVEMDSRSLAPDIILVLDTFHNVLVWRGEYVAQWIKEGYHESEEYAHLRDTIRESEMRAKEIVENRLPTPQHAVSDQHGSQERILLSRVNPSVRGAIVITDDIDFDTFFKCLCNIVVD
jgi:protein transport protein SEC23